MLNQLNPEIVINRKSDWVEGMARFGYAALGVVYTLMGTLTAMAAFGLKGGKTASQQDTLGFLLGQPFGKILLALVALGLLGYVGWQAVQVLKDPQHPDSDSAKGYGRRAGYAMSAAFYAGLAFYAASLVLGSSSSGNGQSNRQFVVSHALDLPMGKWLVLLAAAGTIGFGLFQIYKGISGRFMKYVQEGNVEPRVRKLIERAGRFGFIARGIVLCIVGYLLGKAAMYTNAGAAGDTKQAMRFLDSTSVPYLMGAVAIGLICYGLFMFVRARYQHFSL